MYHSSVSLEGRSEEEWEQGQQDGGLQLNWFFFKTSEIHDCSVWVVASCIFYACSLWSYFSNLCTCIHFFKTRNCFKTTLWSCCSWLKSYYFLRNLLAMDLVVNVEKKWLLPCFLFTFSCAKPWLYDSLLYKRVDLDSHTLK